MTIDTVTVTDSASSPPAGCPIPRRFCPSGNAVLIVIPHDWSKVRDVLGALAGDVFKRVTHGNEPSSFAAEKNTNDPLVVLVGGPGSHEILNEVLTWTDRAGKKRVQWVHSYQTGVDASGVPALQDELVGIPVTNARGGSSAMLAEHVVLGSLYFNRMVWRLQANRKTKAYDRYACIPAADQTMGIVGYGDIGRAVARHAIGGMGVKVKGLRSRRAADATTDDLGVALLHGEGGLHEILETCDVVVAVLPLTPHTRHMIRREHFRRMKRNAIFINIGRGATVVESDLVDAIRAGDIRGAAVDVFEQEPLPLSSPLWTLDDSQILLSPHNAAISESFYEDRVKEFANAARDYSRDGSLPEYRVNLERGY
eukprot:CAMPEP_0174840766 /NCGR_PEP_ID=MMETSP1114-20130205/8889_1 /TAXON_ID=312471 /ORGANISM="Neobodo designis, Strain CCAP 1951/1" /LENGTH=367 /DNA_ID=CAMNT_0016074933 /DNA_START=64 /DNA_END=1167 /DNA_ORIENTATION=+